VRATLGLLPTRRVGVHAHVSGCVIVTPMSDTFGPDLCAGLRDLDVIDEVQGARVPCWLVYPTRSPEQEARFGPYALHVARDAAIEGEALPLVVVSHGTGSTPWVLRDLARTLARHGFVVALVEHPGNSRSDDHLARTAVNLVSRPRHLRLVVDAAYGDPVVGARLAPGAVAVIGHSLGGYTALALAGGRPGAFPHETPDGRGGALEVTHEPRVRALVLLAPATPWFAQDEALRGVRVPILMRTGEHDPHTPPIHAEIVLRGVADRSQVDHEVVAGAGHFSFLSPFPAAMRSPTFPPSQDPPGFDREAYQPRLAAEIIAFLRRAL